MSGPYRTPGVVTGADLDRAKRAAIAGFIHVNAMPQRCGSVTIERLIPRDSPVGFELVVVMRRFGATFMHAVPVRDLDLRPGGLTRFVPALIERAVDALWLGQATCIDDYPAPCCANERRSIEGGCMNCGDPAA